MHEAAGLLPPPSCCVDREWVLQGLAQEIENSFWVYVASFLFAVPQYFVLSLLRVGHKRGELSSILCTPESTENLPNMFHFACLCDADASAPSTTTARTMGRNLLWRKVLLTAPRWWEISLTHVQIARKNPPWCPVLSLCSTLLSSIHSCIVFKKCLPVFANILGAHRECLEVFYVQKKTKGIWNSCGRSRTNTVSVRCVGIEWNFALFPSNTAPPSNDQTMMVFFYTVAFPPIFLLSQMTDKMRSCDRASGGICYYRKWVQKPNQAPTVRNFCR